MWRELSGGVRKVPATLFQREIGRAKIRRTEEGPSFRRRAVSDLADASAVQFPDFTSVYGRGRRATQQVTRSAGHVPGDSAREVIWIGGSEGPGGPANATTARQKPLLGRCTVIWRENGRKTA